MAELINLETRRAKKELSRADVFANTRALAQELGIPEQSVEALVGPAEKLSTQTKTALKDEIYRSSIERLSEQHSYWSERDLTRMVAEEAQYVGLDARDVRELVAEKLASGQDLVRIGTLVTKPRNEGQQVWRDKIEERFTTRETLELESTMLRSATNLARQSDPVDKNIALAVIEMTREKFAKAGKKLSDEQAKAIFQMTSGPGKLRCLVGKAGTSKSSILDACRLAWLLSGREVIGCAIAGVAADSLRASSGIKSETLAMTLAQLKHGRLTLTDKHVVVLDEAAMVPSRKMAELLKYVEAAGATLVNAGDPGQLQAIEAGGPMKSICERFPSHVAELNTVYRQREPWRAETVEQLSRCEMKEVLVSYSQNNQLHITATRAESIAKIVELWKEGNGHLRENGRGTIILAPLTAEVRAINRLCQTACQEERNASGEWSPESVKIAGGEKAQVGDRVLLGKLDRSLQVQNGFTGEVIRIDQAKLVVKLDKDEREVVLPASYAKSVSLGFCSTVHKSQGLTKETVFVLLGGHMMDAHLSYVGMSRSRGDTHLVVDNQSVRKEPTLSDAIRSVSRAMSRTRTKDLAMDVVDQTRRSQGQAVEYHQGISR